MVRLLGLKDHIAVQCVGAHVGRLVQYMGFDRRQRFGSRECAAKGQFGGGDARGGRGNVDQNPVEKIDGGRSDGTVLPSWFTSSPEDGTSGSQLLRLGYPEVGCQPHFAVTRLRYRRAIKLRCSALR